MTRPTDAFVLIQALSGGIRWYGPHPVQPGPFGVDAIARNLRASALSGEVVRICSLGTALTYGRNPDLAQEG